MLTELSHEYWTRYRHTLGDIAEEMRSRPVKFGPPHGGLLLLLSGGEPVAGGAFRRYDERTAELKRIWTDAQNRAAGLPPVKIQYYQSSGDYYLALQSGRIDLYLGPNPGSAYHVAVKGDTKIVGQISGGGEIAADIAAMTKRNNGLVGPLNEALNALIKSGRYGQVLARWNLGAEAVPTSQVNPPGLPRS